MVNPLIGEARITELPLAPGEEVVGIVAALRVSWGNAVVVMLRTDDGVIASGVSARWPGQFSNPHIAEGKARMKALTHMLRLREQQRVFDADQQKRKA